MEDLKNEIIKQEIEDLENELNNVIDEIKELSTLTDDKNNLKDFYDYMEFHCVCAKHWFDKIKKEIKNKPIVIN